MRKSVSAALNDVVTSTLNANTVRSDSTKAKRQFFRDTRQKVVLLVMADNRYVCTFRNYRLAAL